MPYPLIRSRLALHLHLAMFSAATLALPTAHASDTLAPANAVAGVRQYAIAAGPLTDVLSRFANASNVALSFDGTPLQGSNPPGCTAPTQWTAGLRRCSTARACGCSTPVTAMC
ncbi:hypothetical protein [Pseudomonas brassicae]|uniref:hypothetical protein n=1 Tax=Pseudomonas brassicae TaxID=2708063 RepID=UPI001FB358BC|nr:hypothetical protein [Pseudomonas brassicae]